MRQQIDENEAWLEEKMLEEGDRDPFWHMIRLFYAQVRCILLLADPGEARGCSTNTPVNNSLTGPLVKIFLRCRHALMVEDGVFSHTIDYVPIFKSI